jgi:hypothetical protein
MWKFLAFLSFLIGAPAYSQVVTPNFTTGTVNSTTTATQNITETYRIETYGGTQYSVTGSNVTPTGNLGPSATYAVTDATKDFSYSQVKLDAGIISTTDLTRIITTTSVTNSLSVFSQ